MNRLLKTNAKEKGGMSRLREREGDGERLRDSTELKSGHYRTVQKCTRVNLGGGLLTLWGSVLKAMEIFCAFRPD